MSRAVLLCCCLAASSLLVLGHASSDCDSKGFTGLASCSDCELFSEFVHDQQLLADCKSCCVKDAASVMYTKAVIEMCPFKRAGLPHIQDFIKKHAKQFGSRVSVRESVGAYPRLILSDASGGRSSMRIDNWKAATIVEFLKDKLLPAEEESSSSGSSGGSSNKGKGAGGSSKPTTS